MKKCKIIGKLVYLSISFVFDGKKEEYFEDDKSIASTCYGFNKLKGEEIVKNSKI